MLDEALQKNTGNHKKIKSEDCGRSTVAPKISKENMAYMITLAALCFSVSQWSDAQECFQIILLFGGIVFGWLVFQSINSKQNNKKGKRDA